MDMYAHIERVMGDPDPSGDTIQGVRWPVEVNGDRSRGWVERYDDPNLNTRNFTSDEAAAFYVLRVLFEANEGEDFLGRITFGWAVPGDLTNLYPYIDISEV